MKRSTNRFIRWLDKIDHYDQPVVGGKAANLGKLIQAGISCPTGFCTTTEAFESYSRAAGVQEKILAILHDASKSSSECASRIGHLLQGAKVPEGIRASILEAYHHMEHRYGDGVPVAIRSSALVEDSESSSFAGQFDSYLCIKNEQDLIRGVRSCWISLFNARSIAYARRKNFGGMPLAMAVIVQKLVKATKAGVMFTVHPVTSDEDHIVVEATFGLGERLVSGRVSPDTYILSKKRGVAVVERTVVNKKFATLFNSESGELDECEVDPDLQDRPVLSDRELVELARLGIQIEDLFGTPQDIEWAVEDDTIYIVQTRPITVL